MFCMPFVLCTLRNVANLLGTQRFCLNVCLMHDCRETVPCAMDAPLWDHDEWNNGLNVEVLALVVDARCLPTQRFLSWLNTSRFPSTGDRCGKLQRLMIIGRCASPSRACVFSRMFRKRIRRPWMHEKPRRPRAMATPRPRHGGHKNRCSNWTNMVLTV
jgi:hypothetical protein